MRKLLSLVFALAMLVAGCGGSDGNSDSGSTTTVAAATSDAASTTAAAAETTTSSAPATTEAAETTTTASSGGDATALQAALANSAAATSGRIEGSMTMTDVAGASGDVTMGFSGEFDNTAGNSSFTLDMSQLANAAPTGETMPPGMGDLFGEMEIRTIGDTSYMRFGLFSMLGITTDWVSMPATDAGGMASGFGAGPTNPEDLMQAWGASAWSNVEDLGTETVRGVNTTHYRAVVDVAGMMDAADAQVQTDLNSFGTLPDTMPVEFWLGDDNVMHKMVMQFDGSGDSSNGFGSMTMTWEMYDFGADINIEAPPADQVTDGSDLAGMFGG
ncbi:MAG: hypothetical protein WBV06_09260 [Acidimicrobiia bacterium]